MSKPLKIMLVSSEAVPYAKTGGLADVAGALPRALKSCGLDIRVCIPFYHSVREGGFDLRHCLRSLKVPLGDEVLEAEVFETRMADEIPVYLIQREDLYDRPNLYGNAFGDYYDNLERFTFFSHAALRIVEALRQNLDLFHCHDWQTGLLPALLKGPYGNSSRLKDVPTIFTIHNLGYQGVFPSEKLMVTGLPRESFFRPEGLEFWGKVSLLKAGIVYSEAVTTVSPTYAKEIQTPEFGWGMEGLLRSRRSALHGILNGVDYSVWDPATDPDLPKPYAPGKIAGKKDCKAELIREMDMDPSRGDRPLLGMVSRLDRQKGLDLLLEILEDILALDANLVILGAGEEHIQNSLKAAAQMHPGRFGLKLGFDESLAHRIMAGADIFLIPSQYEPCGLTQMYALKYATVPLVRATGGLEDTIIQYDPDTGKGNGFKFKAYDARAFLTAIREGVSLFRNKSVWRRLIMNGMKEDFSWVRSARAYMDLYRSVVEG